MLGSFPALCLNSCGDGSAAGLGVGFVYGFGRFAGLHAVDGELPCRRLGFAGQHPGGLAGRADGHVFVGGGSGHVHAQNAWCQRADSFGLRAAADEQNARDACAQGSDELQAVALGAQQSFDEGAGQVLACGVGQSHAGEGGGGIRAVRRAFAVEVRHQGDAVGAGLGGEGQLGQFVVIHAEGGAAGVEDARTVDCLLYTSPSPRD